METKGPQPTIYKQKAMGIMEAMEVEESCVFQYIHPVFVCNIFTSLNFQL